MSKELLLPSETVILSTADLAGNIVSYNAGFRDASGYTDNELKGKAHSLLRHPDMPKEAFQDLWNTLKAGNTWFGIVKNLRKNGDYYWVAANVAPLRNNNQITGYVSVRYPATREQIKISEALYADIRAGRRAMPWTKIQKDTPITTLALASLAVVTPIITQWLDLNSSISMISSSLVALAGVGYFVYQQSKIQKLSPTLLKGVDDIANHRLHLPIEENTEMGCVFNYLRARVAEQMAKEYDTLREAQILLTAMDSASTNIMIADVHFNIININQNLKNLFISKEDKIRSILPNFSATDVVGNSMDMFHRNPAHQRQMLQNITEPFQAQINMIDLVLQLTVTPIDKDGLRIGYIIEWLDRTIEATIVAELAQVFEGVAKGDFSHKIQSDADGIYLQIKRDVNNAVTVTKQLFAQLDEVMKDLSNAKTQAEQASQAKSLFIHNMTHELRTPLNAIIGFVQLLNMDDAQITTTQKEYLNHAMQSAQHLLGIVNQVLDISNISTGKVEFSQVNFSLNDLVEQFAEKISTQVADKGLKLSLNIAPALPTFCTGDPIRLEQLLHNFLDNAIKFTEKGEITLSVHPSNKDSWMVFEIQDTGIGMSEETQQKLYDSFSQADESVSRQYGGMGLGLAISKGLIEQMGGNINIRSELGIGTKVVFKLPVNHDSNNETQLVSHINSNDKHKNKNNSPLTNKKVLLVEDNKINQIVAIKLLEKMGIEPDVANNGLEAMQMREQKEYDLILLDVQMPIKDGYTTITEIRAEEETTKKHQIVIGLSANGLKGDIDKAKSLGMDDYITKPIDFDLLKGNLTHWLGKN